jgi:Transglycosylase SLT domain
VLKLNFPKALLTVCVGLSEPSLFAREATLLDFTTTEAVNSSSAATPDDKIFSELISEPALGDHQPERPLAQQQVVFDLMSAELSVRPKPLMTGVDLHPIYSLPTTGIRIPAWMQPKRLTLSSRFQSAALFSPNWLGGSFDRCDGRDFSPAWWLDPKVEARRAFHFETVAAVACEYGVPTSLLDAVIAQESGYKYWAISSKGAMGMMQIMPGTATQLGLADPFNSLANMRAGARYLREQLDRFGRVDLALAAYNAGPHRRSLKEGRLPMISETLNYVRTITTNWARLSPRNVEIASVDRGAIAAAAVANSGFRSVSLIRYDGSRSAQPF